MYVSCVILSLSLSLSESVLLLKCTLVLNRYEYDDDIFEMCPRQQPLALWKRRLEGSVKKALCMRSSERNDCNCKRDTVLDTCYCVYVIKGLSY